MTTKVRTGRIPDRPSVLFKSGHFFARNSFPVIPGDPLGFGMVRAGLAAGPLSLQALFVMSASVWSLYLIRCGDGSLYTGIATDIDRRFAEHLSQGPKTAKYLRGKLPLEVVYRRTVGTRSDATKEELQVKSYTRKQKLALILS